MSVMANADINRVPVPEAVVPGTEEKPQRTMLAELKNGKLVFKQKPLSFEKMSETMQEIVNFRDMLEQRIESHAPALTTFPEEHRPLIAKLVHESDKGLQALSKHIQHELLPAQDEDDEEACRTVAQTLPLDVIEKAVKAISVRTNYGLESLAVGGGKVPAAWQVWRWEVKEEYREWLPKVAHEKAQVRFLEREQAKKDVFKLFRALPEPERHAIIGTKAAGKAPNMKDKDKDKVKPASVDSTPMATCSHQNSHTNTNIHALKEKENAETETELVEADPMTDDGSPDKQGKGPGRPKKAVDPEKAAKEKEREAKRLAKAEKEKREREAQNKSRNLFANFFSKPKASTSMSVSASGSRHPSINNDDTATTSGSPKKTQQISDFERTFRPFRLKKDAEIAPVNWFHEVRGKRRSEKGKGHRVEGDVIVIDDDDDEERKGKDEDVEMVDLTQEKDTRKERDLGQMTAEERLHDVLTSLSALALPALPQPACGREHPPYKTYHPHPVRALLTQLTEAELLGDDTAVRSLLSLLRDRTRLPAKVLIFHEDARPGYFGTWTRRSKEVGPRTPFKKDVVAVDYTCDSADEWEGEEEGGEADDVVEGDEEEVEEAGDDSDLDGWLVDDDDEPGTPIDEREGSPDFFGADLPPLLPKRKARDIDSGTKDKDKEKEKTSKKRKVVVPLVPFTKGPCWETVVGRCEYEPFNGYRIHLFNDTPFPIDPFTFVSVDDPSKVPIPSTTTHSHHAQARTEFVIPALPPHITASLHPSGHIAVASSSSASLSSTSTLVPQRRAAAMPKPKTVFPESLVPTLLSTVGTLETGNLTFIVESVHKTLSSSSGTEAAGAGKVKKNAIEAKVREMCEKSQEGRRVWVVKPEIKAAYGLSSA